MDAGEFEAEALGLFAEPWDRSQNQAAPVPFPANASSLLDSKSFPQIGRNSHLSFRSYLCASHIRSSQMIRLLNRFLFAIRAAPVANAQNVR